MKYQIGEMVEVCFKGKITMAKESADGKTIKYEVRIKDEFVDAWVTEEYIYPLQKEEA